jgi:glutaconate CoA-transferase, subunit A
MMEKEKLEMNVLEAGIGELFSDPDADKARAEFRKKSRKMTKKLMPLKDAVEKYIIDGDYPGIGGFGPNRTPIAAFHEIVRQKRRNLGFAGHTATHDMQILCAGDVINRLDVAYVVGLEARGLSKCSRQAIESGKIRCSEWTNYCLAVRLRAAAPAVKGSH